MNSHDIINKLITNACLRSQLVADSAIDSLIRLSRKNPNLIIDHIENFLKSPQKITVRLLNIYCLLFRSLIDQQNPINENHEILNSTENPNHEIESNIEMKNESNIESEPLSEKQITLCKIFKSLHSLYNKVKSIECFQEWDQLCKEFITSSGIAKNVFEKAIPMKSVCSFITLNYCAEFATDEILNRLKNCFDQLIYINSYYYIRLISKLAEKATQPSNFLSFNFKFVLTHFLENPNDLNSLECLQFIIKNISPSACLLNIHQYVKKLCEINLSNQNFTNFEEKQKIIITIENLLLAFCFDTEILKDTIEFLLRNASITFSNENPTHNTTSNNQNMNLNSQNSLNLSFSELNLTGFPIDSFSVSQRCLSEVYLASVENLINLCENNIDVILSILLMNIDTQRSTLIFNIILEMIYSPNIKLTEEQMLMLISSISAVTSKKLINSSLCKLSIELLKYPVLAETDVIALATYLVNASLSMKNSFYLTQIVSINPTYHQIVFELLTEFLFDESKIALLPSLLQIIDIFIMNSNNENLQITNLENINENSQELNKKKFAVHQNPEEEDNSEKMLHPLVPILMKKSINEKSLFLLRILSCLMSLGSTNSFVPAMIRNLSIFFDFTFPLAFDEIKILLDSVSRCINSNSEFPSIIMSLLSNIMKLINDRQFRISLCSAIIHDVDVGTIAGHCQHCLHIFDTIVPFLPVDVAAANIEKIFKVINFDLHSTTTDKNDSVLYSFASVLGSISGRNEALILPLIKTWRTMKSNVSFPVGKRNLPIPFHFIASTLAYVARDIDVPILMKTANTELFPLLIQLMKKKEVHPSYCLNALIELCKRLTFHKVPSNFVLKEFDFLFKYVLNIFLNYKQKQMFVPCLAAFRYLIQVPPCLNATQRGVLREKVVIPSFIIFAMNDNLMFTELRGLLLAILCVIPDSSTLMALLGSLMPNISHHDVLYLVWRILTLFNNNSSESNSSIKFYKNVDIQRIPILPKIIADLIGASYNEDERNTAQQCINVIYRIDRNTKDNSQPINNFPLSSLTKNLQQNVSNENIDIKEIEIKDSYEIGQILNMFNKQELASVVTYAIEGMKKNHNFAIQYSFVLSQVLKHTGNQLTEFREGLITDIVQGTIESSAEFIQELILHFPDLFVKIVLHTGYKYSTTTVVSKLFSEIQCIEFFLQQLCILLLEIPDDDNLIGQIFFFISFLFDSKPEDEYLIPKIHIYQVISSLLIYGFSARMFKQNELYLPSIYQILFDKQQKNSLVNEKQVHLFQQMFYKCIHKEKIDSKIDYSNIGIKSEKYFDYKEAIDLLIDDDKSLLVDVMNFLMSTCQLNQYKVSSGIAMFCGEVLNHLDDLSEKSAITNLYFSTLLSFVSLFDNLTCIVALNEITKLFQKPELLQSFPIQYVSRVFQVSLKMCSSESSKVISSIIVCMFQCCSIFNDKITKKMDDILFEIISEIFKKDFFNDICEQFIDSEKINSNKELNQNINMPNLLIKIIKDENEFSYKYKILYNLLEHHPNEKIAKVSTNNIKDIKIEIDDKNNDIIRSIFQKCIDSSINWMIGASLNMMKTLSFEVLQEFSENIFSLLDHSDDFVSSSAASIIPELLPLSNNSRE
ncbi:hypothetical protein TRFO_34619 [Tritrichomonas foetus]|uniref:Uncharacterized protein n=1 Tax=Tritrichomonas foetus TaxID=1144522 RepID=A0A1J4JII9_9EUKA|nr:hypothetical protein TRFO_34619 [Tritrichomonas foetus]|eukprot:OHS99008.1 hypothetical protein TRFO_34619 [Tritrichomonas foetus]